MKKADWKQYVKVFEYSDEPYPYYIQWVVWCWRKPIWLGLPLIPLICIFMIVDIFVCFAWIITNWGGK